MKPIKQKLDNDLEESMNYLEEFINDPAHEIYRDELRKCADNDDAKGFSRIVDIIGKEIYNNTDEEIQERNKELEFPKDWYDTDPKKEWH